MSALGRLSRVEHRDVWQSEPRDFTPWLALEENLELLSDALGLQLELQAVEQDVGPFRADILCRDALTQTLVLVENQLERTDHLHLGQLVTYAVGLEAAIVVWIAGAFTEDYRAAIDWLNRITVDNFHFFALEVELWRIGTSHPAPKFNVIAKPNAWSQSVEVAAKEVTRGASPERRQIRQEYWRELILLLDSRNAALRAKSAPESYEMYFAIGRAGFAISAQAGFRDGWIAVQVIARDDPTKVCFRQLLKDRENVEKELGFSLDWQLRPEFRSSVIEVRRTDVDPLSRSDWPSQHAWLADKLQALDRVFRPRIKLIDSVSAFAPTSNGIVAQEPGSAIAGEIA